MTRCLYRRGSRSHTDPTEIPFSFSYHYLEELEDTLVVLVVVAAGVQRI